MDEKIMQLVMELAKLPEEERDALVAKFTEMLGWAEVVKDLLEKKGA